MFDYCINNISLLCDPIYFLTPSRMFHNILKTTVYSIKFIFGRNQFGWSVRTQSDVIVRYKKSNY